MQHCTPQCYVDSTKLLLSFVPQSEIETIQDLLKIRNWCFDNQLLLNPNKTNLVIFESRQNIAKVNDFHLSLLGKELVPCNNCCRPRFYFGLKSNFQWPRNTTCFNLLSRLAQINRSKHSFGKQSLTTMITALVFSKLFYCSTVWSNTYQTNLSKF